MAEIIQSLVVETGSAVQSVGQLRENFDQLAASENNASDAGERFAFTNEELMTEQHAYNQVVEQSIAANKALAASSEEVASGMQVAGQASNQLTGTLGQQRIAFQDLGRIITGQGFSLRTISSNFALFGGAVTIAAAAIGYLGYELLKNIQEYQDLHDIIHQYNAAVAESASAQAGNIVGVQKMNDLFEEGNKGLVSRTDVLNIYNKEFGDSVGKAKTYNEAEALFVSKSADYVAAMKQRAIATAAFKLEQDVLTKQIKDQAEGNTTLWQKAKLTFDQYVFGTGKALEAGKDMLDQNKTEAQQLADQYALIGKNATAAGDAIDKASGIDTLGKGKDTKKQHDESLAEQQRYIAESQKILEDAQQKEITSENIKYEKIKADLIKFNHNTEELDTQHQQNLADIQNKYGAIADKLFEEAQEKHRQRQQQIQNEQAKANEELGKLEESYLIKSEKNEGEATQAAIAEEDKKYNAIVAKAKETIANQQQLDKTLEQLAKQHAANISAIQEKGFEEESKKITEWFAKDQQLITNNNKLSYAEKLKDLAQDKQVLDDYYDAGLLSDEDYTKAVEQNSKDRESIKKAELAAYESIASDLGQIDTALTNLGIKNTAANKAIGLAQIAISAGVAVAKVVAAASDSIPFPGNLAAIAASIAVVLADMASAEKLLNSANPSSTSSASSASSFGGGLTTTGGSYSSPSIPATSNVTTLSQSSINQLNNQPNNNSPIRAYVVESDITAAQQTAASYRNNSTL